MGEEATSDADGHELGDLRQRLLGLDGSKERIELASGSFFRCVKAVDAGGAIRCWSEQVMVSTPDQCLYLLYVANEVMQHAPRVDPERALLPLFWRHVPVLVQLTCRDRNARRCAAVLELLRVWLERRIFPPDVRLSLIHI